MYATTIIPEFGLQAILRQEPPGNHWQGQPIALLDATENQSAKDRGKARVIELTAAAIQQGVQLGMKASHAQARCRKLRLLTPDREKEEIAQTELLDRMNGFTPDLEATQPGICTLDLFSTRHAPHGGENFARQALARLAEAGFSARAGVAGNPEAALLAARIARPALVLPDSPRAVQDILRPYPIEILEPDASLDAILRLWGIRQVGDLLALPRDEVTERLGEEAGDLWDRAAGGGFRLLKLVRVPESYLQEKELEYAVETLEPLLFLLRRMLETLAARLEVAYRVAARLVLTLRFEDGAEHERAFQVPDPCRDVELLFRMLHTHLEDFTTAAPIVAVRLEILPGRMLKQQFQLFETTLKDPNRFAETLSRLEAILGTDRIGSPQVRSSHRPDPVEIRPYLEAEKASASESPAASPSPSRAFGLPLRRFRPPAPVQVWCSLPPPPSPEQAPEPPHPIAVRRPNQGQPLAIRTCHGPWRLSGDWWDGAQNWLREEWDAALEDGTLCRLAQVQHRWFLEGTY